MATTTKSRKTAAAKPKTKKRSSTAGKPVTLDGQPAKNRHFYIGRAVYDSAHERAREKGVLLSDVVRVGLEEYAAEAPPEDAPKALDSLPADDLATLKEIWESGDQELINQYLAALNRANWPVRTLAASLVECGAVKSITRQAIGLRVAKAPAKLTRDLPEVPALGMRRKVVSSKKSSGRKGKDEIHDMAFRVTDAVYDAAHRRAQSEGAMISLVLENILDSYAKGEFEVGEVEVEVADN